MYIWPLLFSNLYLGPNGPVDPSIRTLDKPNLARSEASRFLDRFYSPPISFDRGVLDFYYKPWLNHLNCNHHVDSTMSIDDNVLKMTLNVNPYKPEEITVKVTGRWIVVNCTHEKQNETDAYRHFEWKHLLSNGRADFSKITSSISSDNILTIKVPLKPMEEKMIPIEQTGQPAVPSDSAGQTGPKQTGKIQADTGFANAGHDTAGQANTEQDNKTGTNSWNDYLEAGEERGY